VNLCYTNTVVTYHFFSLSTYLWKLLRKRGIYRVFRQKAKHSFNMAARI